MRHRVLSLLFLLVLSACAGNMVSAPELKYGGLNGDVSMTKETCYRAVEKFGEPVPTDLSEVIITEFDVDGHQIKYCQYDEDGDFIFKAENTFEKGLVVSESHELFFKEGKYTRSVVERKKNYIKWQEHEIDGEESFTEFFYNGLHLTIKDEEGEVTTEMDYDKTGHVVEQTNYKDGKVTFRILREFDKKGNMIKMVQYRDGVNSETITYRYTEFDKKGNWTTQIVNKEGKLESIVKREITYR
ncbi:MAG: hypothetical protein II824_00805 [Bacteroidales bacterium]|nr:hypothetical protein [Bacteroidales bacterium]